MERSKERTHLAARTEDESNPKLLTCLPHLYRFVVCLSFSFALSLSFFPNATHSNTHLQSAPSLAPTSFVSLQSHCRRPLSGSLPVLASPESYAPFFVVCLPPSLCLQTCACQTTRQPDEERARTTMDELGCLPHSHLASPTHSASQTHRVRIGAG